MGVVGAYTGFVCPSPASEGIGPHLAHTCDALQKSATGWLEPLGVPGGFMSMFPPQPYQELTGAGVWKPRPLKRKPDRLWGPIYTRAPVGSGQAWVFAAIRTLFWLLLMSFAVSPPPIPTGSPRQHDLNKSSARESSSLLGNLRQDVKIAHSDWWAGEAFPEKMLCMLKPTWRSWRDLGTGCSKGHLQEGGRCHFSVTKAGRTEGEAVPSPDSELETGPTAAPIFPSTTGQRRELGEVLQAFLPQPPSTIYGLRPEAEKSLPERLWTLKNIEGHSCFSASGLEKHLCCWKALTGIKYIQQLEGNRDPGRSWLSFCAYLVL